MAVPFSSTPSQPQLCHNLVLFLVYYTLQSLSSTSRQTAPTYGAECHNIIRHTPSDSLRLCLAQRDASCCKPCDPGRREESWLGGQVIAWIPLRNLESVLHGDFDRRVATEERLLNTRVDGNGFGLCMYFGLDTACDYSGNPMRDATPEIYVLRLEKWRNMHLASNHILALVSLESPPVETGGLFIAQDGEAILRKVRS